DGPEGPFSVYPSFLHRKEKQRWLLQLLLLLWKRAWSAHNIHMRYQLKVDAGVHQYGQPSCRLSGLSGCAKPSMSSRSRSGRWPCRTILAKCDRQKAWHDVESSRRRATPQVSDRRRQFHLYELSDLRQRNVL